MLSIIKLVVIAMAGMSVSISIAEQKDCGVPIQELTFTKSQRPMNAYRNLPKISLIDPGDIVMRTKIINGDSTSIEAIPWQVAMFFHDQKHKKWIFRCGGSILTPKFVMMAGHCVSKTEYPVKPKLYNILAGSNNKQDFFDHTRQGLRHKVKRWRIYPHQKPYKDQKLGVPRFDYGLMELEGEIPLGGSSKARPVCLPDPGEGNLHPGTGVVASGWGTTNAQTWVYPNILQYIKIPVVGKSKCQEIYNDTLTTTTPKKVFDNEMCAGDLENGGYGGGCFGDSGGPLTWKDPATGKYKLIAVVSWGENCGETKGKKYYPGRYAKIIYALKWIKKVIQKASKRT